MSALTANTTEEIKASIDFREEYVQACKEDIEFGESLNRAEAKKYNQFRKDLPVLRAEIKCRETLPAQVKQMLRLRQMD